MFFSGATHNPKVVSSNLAPANKNPRNHLVSGVLFLGPFRDKHCFFYMAI